MRGRLLPLLLVSGLFVFAGGPGVSAQGTGPVHRAEAAALRDLVDSVVAGKPAGGDAWLKWNGHFMRSSDGRVFVPFSLTLDDMTAPIESLAMYVRVVPRGTDTSAGQVRVSGSDGGVPVSVPERQFSRGAPTAGEASARLGLMASEFSGAKPEFEGFFVAQKLTGPAPVVRRSFVAAPGSYDLYVAVRERPRGRAEPKVAVMQTTVSVPDLAGDELTMSSVILADRVVALDKRLSPSQQTERPYAFNSAEVVPVGGGARFEQDAVLSVVFFVYNLAVDKASLPDVTVEYRFLQIGQLGRVFGEMAPQRFGAAHTPPPFDVKAGRQLAVTQALPLATFPPDTYELEIAVTDNLSGRSIVRAVRFTVG
jgi:hypothetical protein